MSSSPQHNFLQSDIHHPYQKTSSLSAPLLSSGVGDTKRAMIGEPRALPYIYTGEIDQGDDTIFASEFGSTSIYTNTCITSITSGEIDQVDDTIVASESITFHWT